MWWAVSDYLKKKENEEREEAWGQGEPGDTNDESAGVGRDKPAKSVTKKKNKQKNFQP